MIKRVKKTKERENTFCPYSLSLNLGDTPPMFFHKTNLEIFQQTSMESAIRNLLKELDLQADVLDRKITPGSLRKSARMVAKKAGMEDSMEAEVGTKGPL